MIKRGWLARVGQTAGGVAALSSLQLILASPVLAAEAHGVPAIEAYKVMWAIINFLFLLAILYKFAYNPILQMLDDRKNTIESSLRHAEEIRVDIERMKQEAQQNLLDSRKEAQEIVARAQQIGEETKAELIAKAKEEAANERARAVAEIESAKEKAVNELRDQAATLAILAAEKVLGKAITIEDHQKMVKDFVNEVGDRLC
ncbi:MAG: F0F1 ATP synthase subunit B [Bacillota bacterium]|jgi:F-type H+-transporting ATPase subunit b